MKARQLRGRRKKRPEGKRRLSERPTVGVDVDDDVQRDDQDGQEAEAELFSEQLHLGTQQDIEGIFQRRRNGMICNSDRNFAT